MTPPHPPPLPPELLEAQATHDAYQARAATLSFALKETRAADKALVCELYLTRGLTHDEISRLLGMPRSSVMLAVSDHPDYPAAAALHRRSRQPLVPPDYRRPAPDAT